VLSRLISLLSRIPAVKWAFNRLRPSPQGGSIDPAPTAISNMPAIIAEVAEAAPSLDNSTDISVATAVAEDSSSVAVIAEAPSAAPADISGNDDSCLEKSADVEPVVAEETPVSAVESAPVDAPESVSHDRPAELQANVEPVVVDETPVPPVEIDSEPVDAPELVSSVQPADPRTDVAMEETQVSSVEAACQPIGVAEILVADDPAPGIAVDVVPLAEEALSPAVAVIVVEVPAAPSKSAADDGPVLVVLPSPPKPNRAPRTPTRAVDPADRATLIRQRWAQTGIRMWNPRLHGTGDATLNIQGRIELLPPEPGDTMPRYDKLEFKLLGGQIVCEGVIVEAPTPAGHRSFTRLAEPEKPAREPVRERQAALA
jgi:hypothetical protein